MYVNFFFLFFFCYKSIFYRETPLNTPQHAHITAQWLERSNWTLDSPQWHRTPHQVIPPPIPPLCLNVPPPPPEVIPGDDPFAFPASVPVPQAGPVEFNGCQYHHLPPVLAEAIQNLAPPPAPPRGRGQDRGHAHIPARPVEFNGNQYHHLPPVLAEAVQNLAPPGRGQD